MGADITGWVECQPDNLFPPVSWVGVIRINRLVGRTYGMFGSLFGHRNADHFTPIAGERGIPPDVSKEIQEFEDIGPHRSLVSASWISWSEIMSIDWEETGKTEIYLSDDDDWHLRRRRDVVTKEWRALFGMMEILAGIYGSDRVRLVVWFDQH